MTTMQQPAPAQAPAPGGGILEALGLSGQTAVPAQAPMTQIPWGEKLAKAGCEGMRMMEQFCRRRHEFITEYLGSNYGGMFRLAGVGSKSRRPFNVLQQGVGVMVPNMVARNPKVKVRARKPVLKGTATVLEMLAEHANNVENFSFMLRDIVTDAVFTCGIAYTNIVEDGVGLLGDDGSYKPVGRVHTDRVSLDDFIPDPTARRWAEMSFAGHRMRFQRDFALDRELFSPEFIEACPTYEEPVNRNNRVDELLTSAVNRHQSNEVSDYFYVTQYVLRREGVMVFMPGVRDSKDIPEGGSITEEREFYGPENDLPYDFLGFAYAPDVLMPVAPVGIWLDMHLAVNTIARKLVDQIKAMKSLVVGDMASEDDLVAMDKAEHTGIVRVRNVDKIKGINWAAPNDSSLAIFQEFMNLNNVIQGNTQLLGGMSSDARTATEAEIVSAGANVRVTDMKDITYEFAGAVQKRRMWYHFHDDFVQETLTREVSPGVSIQLPVDHSMMEGEFIDYNFEIEVGSMQRLDPMVKSKRKADSVQVFGQAIQIEALSQFRFNAQAYIEAALSDTFDAGELESIWRTPEAAMELLTVNGLFAPQGPMTGMSQPPASGPGGRAPAAPGAGAFPVRAPGVPGSAGMPGRSMTGAASPNFNRGANTAASKAASRGQQ